MQRVIWHYIWELFIRLYVSVTTFWAAWGRKRREGGKETPVEESEIREKSNDTGPRSSMNLWRNQWWVSGPREQASAFQSFTPSTRFIQSRIRWREPAERNPSARLELLRNVAGFYNDNEKWTDSGVPVDGPVSSSPPWWGWKPTPSAPRWPRWWSRWPWRSISWRIWPTPSSLLRTPRSRWSTGSSRPWQTQENTLIYFNQHKEAIYTGLSQKIRILW